MTCETNGNKIPKRITKTLLKRLGDCKEGIAAFVAVFPKGVAMTPETLQVAFDAELDLDFLSVLLGCYQYRDNVAISALYRQYDRDEITWDELMRRRRRIGTEAILWALEAQK